MTKANNKATAKTVSYGKQITKQMR